MLKVRMANNIPDGRVISYPDEESYPSWYPDVVTLPSPSNPNSSKSGFRTPSQRRQIRSRLRMSREREREREKRGRQKRSAKVLDAMAIASFNPVSFSAHFSVLQVFPLLLLLLLPSVNLWFFVFGGCVSLIKTVPFALFPHGSCSFLYNSNPRTIERAWNVKILLAAFQSSFEGRNYPSWESGLTILRYFVYIVFLVLLLMKSFRSSRHLS